MSRCDHCGARNAAASDDGTGWGRKVLCASCRASEVAEGSRSARARLVVIEGNGVATAERRARPAGSPLGSLGRGWRGASVPASDAHAREPQPQRTEGEARLLILTGGRKRLPRAGAPPPPPTNDGSTARVLLLPTARGLERRRRLGLVRLGGTLIVTAALAALAVTVVLEAHRRRDAATVGDAHQELAVDDALDGAGDLAPTTDRLGAQPVHDLIGLAALLHRHEHQLADCLSRSGTPASGEQQTLRLTIEPHGHVSVATLVGDPIPGAATDACIRAAARGWRLPPVRGVRMQVDVPLHLPARQASR